MGCPDPATSTVSSAGGGKGGASGKLKMSKKERKALRRQHQHQQQEEWETGSSSTTTTNSNSNSHASSQKINGGGPAASTSNATTTTTPPLVGYAIRFDDRTGPATRIKYMTDGFLLREMMGPGLHRLAALHNNGGGSGGGGGGGGGESEQANGTQSAQQQQQQLTASDLARYSVLIIDEAHERTLDTDLVLGMAKSIQRERRAKWDAWVRAAQQQQQSAAEAGGEGKKAGAAPPSSSQLPPPPPPPLKIIVMSATLDAEKFAEFFSSSFSPASGPTASLTARQTARTTPAPILYVQGRQHAVETLFTRGVQEDWQDAALKTVLQIHLQCPPGDVLVFMTGQEEIEKLRAQLDAYARDLPAWHEGRVQEILLRQRAEQEKLEAAAQDGESGAPAVARKRPRALPTAPDGMLVLPMYAALGSDTTLAAFQTTPPHMRKVVLATNIAETSVTIPGIRYVVDPGLAKVKTYSSTTGIEMLQTQPISRSSAMQRAGRAGRDGPGQCYFLYPSEELDKLDQSALPDILKVDLSNACLQLCAVGRHPLKFDWIDKPDDQEISLTLTRLVELGAVRISPQGKGAEQQEPVSITPIGAKMAMLPLSPSYARILLGAAELSPTAARQARDLVAILSADRGIFVEPTNDNEKRDAATRARASLAHPSGDHATYLSVLYQFLSVREQAGRSGKKSEKVVREEVKSWCEAHYLHHRTLQSILSIRAQLQRICKQYGIVCDDEGGADGKKANGRAGSLLGMQAHSDDDDDDDDSAGAAAAKDGLFVRKAGERAANEASWRAHHDERYEDLRRALLTARLSSVALKMSDGRGYKRGDQIVKIHPSSVIAHKQPDLIVSEEIVLTSQLFVRCVSAVEPAWFQEAIQQARKMAQ